MRNFSLIAIAGMLAAPSVLACKMTPMGYSVTFLQEISSDLLKLEQSHTIKDVALNGSEAAVTVESQHGSCFRVNYKLTLGSMCEVALASGPAMPCEECP